MLTPAHPSPQSRWAVVTGASRGIGRAICLRLCEQGFSLHALARSQEGLAELEKDVKARGGQLELHPVDLANPAALAEVVTRLSSPRSGPPEVLVNNAGLALSAPLERTSSDDFERVMALNVRAPYLLCQSLLPKMAAAGRGRVVNIASTAALRGFKYTSAYCASKHALLGLTRALALEYAARGVTVNAVCPGWTDTDLLADSARALAAKTGRSLEEARGVYAKMNPQGRVIQPAEVAGLVSFLVSSEAAGITGAAYTLDGGETL